MTEPSLHDLRSIGNHIYHSARKNGEDTSTPLAFLGAVTVAIGAKMLWDAYRQRGKPFPGRSR